ncbi:MAG: hypothetical protein Q4G13_08275 [Moraxella sp.]|nr:hypothetical protein [Moraxella sp.]
MTNPYTPPATSSTTVQTAETLPLELDITMKLIALAPQFYLHDKRGRQVGYIRQKLFKLKEAIEVFHDDSKERLSYSIKADRILDFGAAYSLISTHHGIIGHTKRHAIKSIWRTEFDIYDEHNQHQYTIRLSNPLAQFIESLITMIPFIGDILNLVSGYFLNAGYTVTDLDDNEVAHMKKLPALFEGKYQIRAERKLSAQDQERIALSLLTVILIQRASDG